ncbi:MAG TPA: bifunctional DNA-formamidopyrimidine glycosylase/DNA-(apurinic or apyrimidinic site) lyase [Gemmatimonadaceae bacterium]|nr:bifunctional DNA-formamidopyrimidine glycosylase/DNA-(apurinic or apyrimidinic site) lyase [Gemmatimonadaceae bacterium]
MPELPEVESARRVLERAVRGKTIASVVVSHRSLRRCVSDEELAALAGRHVARVTRRGKHQLIHLDDGGVVHVHFRMNGDWSVGRDDEPLPRYERASLVFTDGTRVSLVDSRALCTLSVHDSVDSALPDLGLEATDPRLDAASLGASLARRRVAIKVALLDQRVVAGLGNIYAAEALWHARIDPRASAASLSAARRARLVDGMRAALAAADSDPGRYSRGEGTARLEVYGREGERCSRCGGTIRRIVQAGRSTFYCPKCQR